MSEKYERRLADAKRAYEEDDMQKAIALFTELADEGVPEACQYLGMIYRTGDGVSADEMLSLSWYSKYVFLISRLAENGDPHSQMVLGKLYQYGEHVRQDEAKAVSLFKKAADADVPDAEFHLATLYRHGWCGCDRSDELYWHWLERAVRHRHPESLYMKGLALIGSVNTSHEGLSLIKRAAALGFWPAANYLEHHGKRGRRD